MSRSVQRGALVALVAVFVAMGCSDDATPELLTDSGRADGASDQGALFPCTSPKQACNAHDPCAISPICGDDLLCHPQGYANCDDGVACTKDSCGGQGTCLHQAVDGKCAIAVKGNTGTALQCFDAGEANPGNPCQVCEPAKAGDAWTAKEGACDDGDECTRDDYCQQGVCKGTDFHTKCEDKHACTTTHCDGKGACLPSTLDAGACLIDGVCISATGLDGSGCKICDPARSTSQWSIRDKVCKVGDKCYGPGDTHPGAAAACATCVPGAAHEWQPASGHCLLPGKICKKSGDVDTTACKTCDPAVDKYAWSAASGRCAIAGKCYTPKAIHPEKCATCDLASSTWAWTVQGSTSCLIGNACYAAGASDGSTCSSCQPAQSKVAWTVSAGQCRLNGACYKAGETDPSGCLVCQAGAPRSWRGAGSTTILWQNDFEGGVALPAGMSETHDDAGDDVKWQVVVGRRALSGNGAIYYGNPAAGDYDNGVRNSGILTVNHLVLPATKKAGAHFSVYLDIEETYPSGFVATDAIQVRVKGVATPLWIKPGLKQHSKYKTWLDVNVDLSAYAGKTIDLEFSFDTLDDSVNSSEGIYVDDITIYGGC